MTAFTFDTKQKEIVQPHVETSQVYLAIEILIPNISVHRKYTYSVRRYNFEIYDKSFSMMSLG